MKEKMMLTYGDYIFYIDQYIYESDEMFYFRINYIYNILEKQKNDNNKIYIDNIIGLSKIECQKKFNNCEYFLTTRI